MRILEVELCDFRNFAHQKLEFGPFTNIVTGRNAQGKTNLIESLFILSTAKSFRQGRERDWVRFGSEFARVLLTYQSLDGTHTLELRVKASQKKGGRERKEILADGLSIRRNGELALKFCTVLFEPGHLNLVKEGPEERRRFLDTAISQLKPRYAGALEEYNRVVSHKGALLRRGSDAVQLEVFNDRLAKVGGYLTLMRGSYVSKLSEFAAEHHQTLSGGREVLSVSYQSFFGGEVPSEELSFLQQKLRTELNGVLNQELERGVCLVGPHRDDLEILVDDKAVRIFGSQGQQRSAAMSLKLGECQMVEQTVGEPPVLLLDDVLSELDRGRQQVLKNSVQGRQTILTTCNQIRGGKQAEVFLVKAGDIVKRGNPAD